MKTSKLLILFLVLLGVSSCGSLKKVSYFQDIDETKDLHLETNYETKIKKDDLLTIVVSGPDKAVVAPFNLTIGEMSSTAGNISGNPVQSVLGYLVNPNGAINFPLIGEIKVEGMTSSELRDFLTTEIKKYVKDPIVYVALKNYKITILGEVAKPGTYIMESEKNNILQVLGTAGDLKMTAKRKDIIIIREVEGKQTHTKINLLGSEIFSSPYFFLQQNDIVYVPPTKAGVIQGTTPTGVWSTILSSVSVLIAIITIGL